MSLQPLTPPIVLDVSDEIQRGDIFIDSEGAVWERIWTFSDSPDYEWRLGLGNTRRYYAEFTVDRIAFPVTVVARVQ